MGPSINYVRTLGESGGGGCLASYTFLLHNTSKRGEGVQEACKKVYVPLGQARGDYSVLTFHG